MPTNTARLLHAVNLSLPLAELECAILQWASLQGLGEISAIAGLEALRSRLQPDVSRNEAARHLVMDLDLGLGAVSARQREKASVEEYYAEWESLAAKVAHREITEMDQLRSLQQSFGGVLLNGRSAPFVLLVPLSDGSWLQVGWKTMSHLDAFPMNESLGRPPAAEISTRRFKQPTDAPA